MVDKLVTAGATLICLGACVAMWTMEKEPPTILLGITGVLVGRYVPMPGSLFQKK